MSHIIVIEKDTCILLINEEKTWRLCKWFGGVKQEGCGVKFPTPVDENYKDFHSVSGENISDC